MAIVRFEHMIVVTTDSILTHSSTFPAQCLPLILFITLTGENETYDFNFNNLI